MHRAMATCLILMFGRIGGVGGSNFVGLLLDVNCDLIFFLYSGLILSEFNIFWKLISKVLLNDESCVNRLRCRMLLPKHKSNKSPKDGRERWKMRDVNWVQQPNHTHTHTSSTLLESKSANKSIFFFILNIRREICFCFSLTQVILQWNRRWPIIYNA